MKQICTTCGATGETSEFYAGLNSKCKECHKAKVRENRAAKAEYYRMKDADRYQNDPRVKERHRRYQQTPSGLAAMKRARDKWCSANPDRRAAHVILGNAVRDKRIEKPDNCSTCGAGGVRIEAHHDDYSLPLVVKWLCRKCHVAAHR